MTDDIVVRQTDRDSFVSQTTHLTLQYGREYYEGYGDIGYSRENWLEFFRQIADEIACRLRPRTVLDVGCAKGFLVECLRDRGVQAHGVDISEYAISEVRPDVRPYCWVGSAVESIKGDYDLMTCIEVCEHLPEMQAHEAIRQMTLHTNIVLFSSPPGHFDEPTHINVHPMIDWLRLFAQFSFGPDEGFDASFVAPWAMLLRRVQVPLADRELCRFAYLRYQAEVSALRRELDTIVNSRGWKLLNRYRKLRALVKQPLAKGLSKLNPMRS